jgi:hypothetical protein
MSVEPSPDLTPWIKASASGAQGQCVELRRYDGMVEVRDSKQHEDGPILRFTSTEWSAWLDGAKKGEFDHLV